MTGSFALTPVEIILSVGIIAAITLLFILGMKFMEVLPEKEPVKEIEEKPAEEADPDSEEVTETEEESAAASEGQ